MEQVLQQILEVLNGLLDCCEKMSRLAKEEGEALKANDVQKLSMLNETMAEHASCLSQLEKKRIAYHDEAVKMLGLPNVHGYKELLAAIKEMEGAHGLADLSNQLEETSKSLSRAYKELKEQTELNHLLVKQSVAYINNLMDILSPDHRLFYKKGGEMNRNRLQSPFVNQTV